MYSSLPTTLSSEHNYLRAKIQRMAPFTAVIDLNGICILRLPNILQALSPLFLMQKQNGCKVGITPLVLHVKK